MSEDLRRVTHNTGWLLLRHVANKGIGFGTTAYLARQLGVGGFGKLSAMLSFSQTFTVFGHLGLIGFTIKEVADTPERAPRWFVQGMVLIAALSGLTFVVMMGAAWLLGARLTLSLLALIGAALLVGQLGTYAGAYAQGLERMNALAVGEIILRSALLAGCWVALSANTGLAGVGVSYLVAHALFSLSMTLMVVPRLFRPTWEISRQIWSEKLSGSWPYFLSGMLTVVYMNTAMLLSARLAGAEATGYFSGAFGLMMAVRLIPNVALNALFPTLVRRVRMAPEQALPLYARYRRFILSLMIPISVGGVLLAPNFVVLVFGDEFGGAVPAAMVMLGAVWMMTLHATVGYLMVAINRIPVAIRISLLGVLLQASLAIAWIPAEGALGAAWAFVVAEAVTLSTYTLYLVRSLGDHIPFRHLVRCTAAALAMAWAVERLRWLLPLPGLILAGAVIYFVMLALLGGIDEEDRDLVSRALGGRR